MSFSASTHTEEETIALGERLGKLLSGGAVVLLCGDLGAGKTRFAKGVARGLGVIQALTSPTFNLVLEYPLAGCPVAAKCTKSAGEGADNSKGAFACVTTLRHLDLYRLERAEQLDDFDYFGLIEDEYAVSLVEWGNRFAEALPLDYVLVEILVSTEALEQRFVTLSAVGAGSKALLKRFIAAEKQRHHAGELHD